MIVGTFSGQAVPRLASHTATNRKLTSEVAIFISENRGWDAESRFGAAGRGQWEDGDAEAEVTSAAAFGVG